MHAETPAPEDEPRGQFVHVEVEVAPSAAENVPAGQAVQDATPITPEYEPAVHFVHDDARANEYMPMGQIAHVEMNDAPNAPEYVPGGQEVHAENPAPEYEPVGQELHVADELAPTTFEKSPVLHFVHTALETPPVAPEYVPTGHPTHNNAPAPEYVPAPQTTHGIKLVPE